MRVLVDIGHPAHVHLFKNIALDMQQKGHIFFFTVRSGENEALLLEQLGFEYSIIGHKRRGVLSKLAGLVVFTARIILIARDFRPDLFLSHGSMYAGYASLFAHKPHIALEDTGNMEQLIFSVWASDVILTPDTITKSLGKKQIKYSGFHELAYLDPMVFKPDAQVLDLIKVKEGERYAILRFISWRATHDIGENGIGIEDKIVLVKKLSAEMKVFISSEEELPEELAKYKLEIPFHMIHHVLAFADVYIGEGATMATESSILGVQSIYLSSIDAFNHFNLESYGLLKRIKPSHNMLQEIEQSMKKITRIGFAENHSKMLSDKINVVAFMVWFIENWPESFKIAKSDDTYQREFRRKQN